MLASSLRATLTTLTITLPRTAFCSHHEFYTYLGELVAGLSSLREFTLYAPGGVRADTTQGVEDDLDDFERTNVQPSHDTLAERSDTSISVPKVPHFFLRALLTDKQSGTPHRRLTMLRIHGIVCSMEGLQLIGQDAAPTAFSSSPEGTGLQDLVLQLENGPLLNVIERLQPLAPTLQKLHILSRAGAQLVLYEDDVAWLARSLVAAPQRLRDDGGRAVTTRAKTGALKQIGFRHRVWEVHRELLPSANDAFGPSSPSQDDEVSVSLQRWDASEGRFPEALLVVKA